MEIEMDKGFVKNLLSHEIVRYKRGSSVYGTFEKGVSDIDWWVIVDDSCKDGLSRYPKGMFEYTEGSDDMQFLCESTFLKMLEDNCIDAIECISHDPDACGGKYSESFVLDKWKLRQSVSSISSNSWVKCKKKLTVQEDYNLRVAQKSLWHSMRLYMFGIQVALEGKVVNFNEGVWLWREIKEAETPTWEYYKMKYQELHNNLRSSFVKYCEKPKEEL